MEWSGLATRQKAGPTGDYAVVFAGLQESRCRADCAFEERQQSLVNLLRMESEHPVRISGIHFERCALEDLDGLECGIGNRHNLVVIAMHDESGNDHLLQVFGEIGFGESLYVVEARFGATHHALQPPVLPYTFGDCRARPVVPVKM